MKANFSWAILVLCVFAFNSCKSKQVSSIQVNKDKVGVLIPEPVDDVQRLTDKDVEIDRKVSDENVPMEIIGSSSYIKHLTTVEDTLSDTLEDIQNPGSTVRDAKSLKEFSVVAGSFSTLESALAQVKNLKAIDYDSFIVKNENGMFRVIAGTYDDRDDADFLSLKLDLDSIETWILIK